MSRGGTKIGNVTWERSCSMESKFRLDSGRSDMNFCRVVNIECTPPKKDGQLEKIMERDCGRKVLKIREGGGNVGQINLERII